MILPVMLYVAEPLTLPAPPIRVSPTVELNPPDYSGVCDVKPLSGDQYSLKISVGGNGQDRILIFASVEPGLVPDKAQVVESVRLGNAWIQERLALGDGQSKLFGSIQWNVGESVGRLNIWEPMVGYSPMKTILAGKCQLEFGDKS